MTVSLVGLPLEGPTFVIVDVTCTARLHEALLCKSERRGSLGWVPMYTISEDSEVIAEGDCGSLIVTESYAVWMGWLAPELTDAAQAIFNREAAAIKAAKEERRLDKLPCTKKGAYEALSLTYQIYNEYGEGGVEGFTGWVNEMLPRILGECSDQPPVETHVSAVEAGRTLPGPREARLYEAHQALIKAFGHLGRCRCGSLATHLCLDAAGMGVCTCEAHAKPGGMDGSEGPFPLEGNRYLKEAFTLLSEALGIPAAMNSDTAGPA
jgi:hypothetical protein